ncbi:MAG: hypothetical protein NZ920_01170 [Aigarchaeota archaeon]|nr:hypothetical protein [Aigarchaeota archaeon]MDW8093052.1 hypothetical protein [Nitrososphaerota archaeon]
MGNNDQVIEEVVRRYRELKERRGHEEVVRLIDSLKGFAPPGVEWGIEFGRIPGVSYILEGGRVVALRVSRDEFGPFMQTSLKQVDVKNVPSEALKEVSERPENFITKVVDHLSGWLERAPTDHQLRGKVEALVKGLKNEL